MVIINVLWSAIFVSCLNTLANSAAFQHQCNEPNDLEQRFDGLNNGLDLKQLLILHGWTDLEIKFNTLFTLSSTDEISKKCPNTTKKGNYPVMMRSSCPWFFETDYSEDRYPKNITFAKTKCGNGCIGSNAGQNCERINYQIKILRKIGCGHGQNTYEYKAEDFLLPIGYTCAQAREAISSTPTQDDFLEPI